MGFGAETRADVVIDSRRKQAYVEGQIESLQLCCISNVSRKSMIG